MMDMLKMMKQAKEMQSKMQDMQANLSEITVEGHSGGDMVSVTLNGKGAMSALKIDPSLFKDEESDVIEDLVIAAHNDAKERLEKQIADKTQEMMGGMGLPADFKMPF